MSIQKPAAAPEISRDECPSCGWFEAVLAQDRTAGTFGLQGSYERHLTEDHQEQRGEVA